MKRVTGLALLAFASAVPSGCSGGDSVQRTSQNQLITLGHSIGGIRLGEPRTSVEEAFGLGTSRRSWSRLVLRGPPSRRLLVPRWTDDTGPGPRNHVGRLPYALRRACRVKPRGIARSPPKLPRRGVPARGGAHARCTGDCLHDATRHGRPNRRFLQLTKRDSRRSGALAVIDSRLSGHIACTRGYRVCRRRRSLWGKISAG